MDRGNHQARYRVQSVYDAFRLLEFVATAANPVTTSQAAAELGEPRNRVFRLLRTLEESGYIVQDPITRAYLPSLKLVTLGHVVGRSRDLEAVAQPIMERLRNDTGETVYLVARDGGDSVCLITLESNHLMRICAQPGRRWPLGRGAAGQALLVSLPNDACEQALRQQPQLQRIWPQVQERFKREGITFVDGREGLISDEGVMAIAAPVRDGLAGHALAMALAWPIGRSTADYKQFRVRLLDACKRLENALGNRTGEQPAR